MADLRGEFELIRRSLGGENTPEVASAILTVVHEVVSCVGRATAALEKIAADCCGGATTVAAASSSGTAAPVPDVAAAAEAEQRHHHRPHDGPPMRGPARSGN